jgi:hypothetical protein
MKNILTWLMVVLTICSSVVIALWVELTIIQKPPEVEQVVYSDKIKMPNGEWKNFVEVNRYEAKTNSGNNAPAMELRINAYTDPELRYAMGIGIQWVDFNKNGKFGVRHSGTDDNAEIGSDAQAYWDIENIDGLDEITIYATQGTGGSFLPIDGLNRQIELYFTSTDENGVNIFRATFSKYKIENWTTSHDNTLTGAGVGGGGGGIAGMGLGLAVTGGNPVGAIIGGVLGLIFGGGGGAAVGANTPTIIPHEQNIYYTFEDFLLDSMNLTNSSFGYGEYELEAFTINKYFNVKLELNGQAIEIEQSRLSSVDTYFAATVYKKQQGLSIARQSLFGMVAGDSLYNTSAVHDEQDFWKFKVNYNLSINDFDMTYSAALGGELLRMKQNVFNYLTLFDNLNINVDLNLTGYNVVGLNSYCFFGLELNNLNITANAARDFYLQDYSLWDTDLKSFTVSPNINIIVAESAYNGDLNIGGN